MKFLKQNKAVIIAFTLTVLLMVVGFTPMVAFLIGGSFYLIPVLVFGSFMKKAKRLLNNNEFDQAVATADQVAKLRIVPKAYLAFIQLVKSDALQRLGKFNQSLDNLRSLDISASTEMLQSNYNSILATSLLHTKGDYKEIVEAIDKAREHDGRVYLEFMEIYAEQLLGKEFSLEKVIKRLKKNHMELRDYDFATMEEKDILYRLKTIFLNNESYVDTLKVYYLGKILENSCQPENLVVIYSGARQIEGKSYFKSYCNRFVRLEREKGEEE